MNQLIKNALLNGRLVLLLGAGASIGCKNSLGESPPMGEKLAKILAEEIGNTFEEEDDLTDVYGAARQAIGSGVDNLFERHFKHCQPSDEYRELIKYPFFRIYTLNIDDGLEKAAHSQESRKFNVKRRNDKVTDPDQFFQTLDLIKLNGDVALPSDGFIFSVQEYAKGSSEEPLWYSELARDYHRFTFLFIGTKLKEPLFFHQIQKFKSKVESTDLTSYVLVPTITSNQKKSLESSNINHIPATFSDFIDWLRSEFENPPSPEDVVKKTRPELKFSDTNSGPSRLNVFDGVTPVSRSSLGLVERPADRSQIRDFYKGFKPTWFDILDDVPALLTKVSDFYDKTLSKDKASPLDIYLLFGSAGCGKTTALKQIALKLADEGTRNVYFIEEYKDNLRRLIKELDERNDTPYYIIIERVGDLATYLSEIVKSSISEKAIFITAENPNIWHSRVKEHLGQSITESTDISQLHQGDATKLLEKLQTFGNWTRLAKMSPKNRKIEILKKSKRQLLIGLIEATSGEGYNKIIQKDFASITCESERALLILAGLATTQRVAAHESTLTRAMSYLNKNPNIHYVAAGMSGILSFQNGKVTTRHRVYIEKLFRLYVPKDEMLKAISAYIKAFSVYDFPVAKNISRSELTIYKHLVNAKYLKKVLSEDKAKVLQIYEEFEKVFEHEGLFLMQYGLALRSFDENDQAFEKLRVAYEAYPESSHIEHALAQQRIILACNLDDETVAMAHLEEARSVLNRLHSSYLNVFDSYPIITLSEGHVKVLLHFGHKSDAKIIAKGYYDQISKLKESKASSRLEQALSNLTKFYLTGIWPEPSSEGLTS